MVEAFEVAGRYSVARYRPSGRFSPAALSAVAGVAVLSGLLVGAAGAMLAKVVYLVLLFPVGFGAAVGALAAATVRWGRVRSPLAAGLAGLVGGALVMPALHGYGYQEFRAGSAALDRETREELRRLSPNAITAELRAQGVQPQMIRAAQVSSFFGYIDLQAHQGVSLRRHGSGGIHLGHAASYLYWALELLVAAGAAFLVAFRAAGAPFCDGCGRWMAERRLRALRWPAEGAVKALGEGDLERLRAPPQGASPAALRLTVTSCARCETASTASVRLELVDRKGTAKVSGNRTGKTLAHTTYPGAAIPALRRLVADRDDGDGGAGR